MKATQKQYEQAIKHYDAGGASAVFAFAECIGVDSHSFCRDCEEHTPDCHDDCCLVCGTHKPSTRKPQLILRDAFSVLYRPLEARQEDRHRMLPPFTGGDDWHNVSSMLDLNVWGGEFETKAAMHIVADGKTLTGRDCSVPIEVIDNRTKPEPEPESVEQTIERLTGTIEQLRRHAQRTINLMENREYVDSLQRSLDAIINKHQQSY
jgi:hypothetical protein